MKNRKPWSWIPTLYFAEGLPYIAATEVAIILFANLGLSNTYNAIYTSLFILPSIFIKFVFGPLLDLVKTKRFWIITFQWVMSFCFGLIALAIPADFAIKAAVWLFMFLAFNSALHDIAADGFYLLALDTEKQSFFVGIRNTFYRMANIFAQGLMVAFVGFLFEGKIFPSFEGKISLSWAIGFAIFATILLVLTLYHTFTLPKPVLDKKREFKSSKQVFSDFGETFKTFFARKNIGLILFFLLTYRLGEAQLVRLAKPFLLDELANGGLALKTSSIGLIYGTLGVAALLAGGILGGILISKHGLKKWLIPMVLFINIPDVVYVMMAYGNPSTWLVAFFVLLEQFGYGFGFTAYMLFLIHIVDGRFKTAHYAFGTGIMALSVFIPGIFAGKIQDMIGYQHFFVWVLICTIPGFIATYLVKKKMF